MRFFVEVTPIGKNDTQQYCVDADSWQKALQHARAIRKEDGSISGFSIELADDGYRAVDPTARIRYMVKKAPADAQLSPGASQPPPRVEPSVKPPAASSPPQMITAPSPSQAPSESMASRRMGSRTMSFGSSGTALLASSQPAAAAHPPVSPVAPAAPKSSPSSPSRPAPPRAASVAPSPVAPLVSTAAAAYANPEKQADSHSHDHDFAPTSRRPAGPIVVLYKKEQEPTTASPITYREEVFAAAPGTTEEQAEAVLRATFKLISESLASAPPGKYVNIAVFDRVFEGRPPVPPLATLTWKDWKGGGAPTVTFPRRAKAQLETATQPSLSQAAGQAVSVRGQPVSVQAAPTAAEAPAPARAPRQLRSEPPASNDARSVSAAAPPARARVEPETSSTVVVTPDDSMPIIYPPGVKEMEAQYVPQAAPPVAVQEAFPAPAVPPPAIAPPAAASSGHMRRAAWKQTPAALDGSKIRVRGDELIGLLFEEMHDLNFMADALEGAAFCLFVALDKLPSRAGFVHFYDVASREYVVASVAGAVGTDQVTRRNSQNDPWLAEAMRRRQAYVVGDARNHEGANVERFAAIGGAVSVIVAPVMLGGRALGAIEIVNPVDGAPFGEDDANALAYMAEQFAEFVSSHGLVTDEGRIRRASLQPPA
jgi:putative methionine-R-sulfoxide reductase with GAF domain